MHFRELSRKYKEEFESYMYSQVRNESKTDLEQAMRYSLEAGGKRLRPLILFAIVEAFEKNVQSVYPYGAALEMIHTYSLIHDDLPAMDDDDLRRGKPTNHIEFNEATAILAGDALLTKAFELMTDGDFSSEVRLQLIKELAIASGHEGMVGGQQADMAGEHQTLTVEELEAIHARKTGKLIHFAFYAGGILAEVQQETLNDLISIAYKLGVAYQIRDDILDVQGSQEELGKRVGADAIHGKSSYPALLGLEQAHTLFKDKLSEALKLNKEINRRETTYDEEIVASFIQSLDI